MCLRFDPTLPSLPTVEQHRCAGHPFYKSGSAHAAQPSAAQPAVCYHGKESQLAASQHPVDDRDAASNEQQTVRCKGFEPLQQQTNSARPARARAPSPTCPTGCAKTSLLTAGGHPIEQIVCIAKGPIGRGFRLAAASSLEHAHPSSLAPLRASVTKSYERGATDRYEEA